MQKTFGPRLIQNQLLFGQLGFSLGATALSPLLQPLQVRFGLSIFELSILPTTYTIAVAVTNLAAGIIISRFGARKLHQVGAVVAILACTIGFFAGGFLALLLTYLAFGIGMALAFVTLTTLYSHQPERYRDFGRYHAFFGLAGIVSPLLVSLTLETTIGYPLLFIGVAVLTLVNLLVFAASPHIADVRGEPMRLSQVLPKLKHKPTLISLIALAVYAAAEVGVTTFAMSINSQVYRLQDAEAAFWFSSFWVGYTFSRFVTDILVRRFGLLKVLTASAIGGLITISLWAAELGPYFLTLTGLFISPIFPALQKNMNNLVDPADRGLVNGATYAFTGSVTTAFIPVMGAVGDIRLNFAAVPPVLLLIGVIVIVRTLLVVAKPQDAVAAPEVTTEVTKQ